MKRIILSDGHNTTRLQFGCQQAVDAVLKCAYEQMFDVVGVYQTNDPLVRTSDEEQRAMEIVKKSMRYWEDC